MTTELEKRFNQKIEFYWNERIHDLEIVRHPVGTPGFFNDLDEYRFDKLRYLPRLVDFSGFSGKNLLEIGCGAGIDLVRFAAGGAKCTGVDLSRTAIDLAKMNFKNRSLNADLRVMNGESLEYPDGAFDVVYAHGVLQYTADSRAMVEEARRVLKPGGKFIAMVYNRNGWLNVMSRRFHIPLEHEDAPVLNKYSIGEFRRMLSGSRNQDRSRPFPVKSSCRKASRRSPSIRFRQGVQSDSEAIVRRAGWHLMAFATK
jgi:SAM-dependent methyltransferase